MYNQDCLEAMSGMEDNSYELAIVDPDFGIGKNWNKDTRSPFYKHKSIYQNESIPDKKYFDQLFRTTKKQIIWGCNYYVKHLPAKNPNNLIVWNKKRSARVHRRSAGEIAWTSITKYPLEIIDAEWNGCCTCEPRYGKHPHEKPTNLYRELLRDWAAAGDRILDTHGGSGAIAIACYDMGFDLDWFEIDPDYYNDARQRFQNHKAQGQLFTPKESYKPKQTELL